MRQSDLPVFVSSNTGAQGCDAISHVDIWPIELSDDGDSLRSMQFMCMHKILHAVLVGCLSHHQSMAVQYPRLLDIDH